MVKLALWIVLAVVGILLLSELALRVLLGFGNPLLYIADEQIGYLLAPNQQVRRYGNRIAINQYSMRSGEITPTRSPNTLRILLLGDSVANGGWWTNQNDIISELLERQLQVNASTTVEVLNASANSWGPRNELAYIQKFGSFESQVVVLLLNTDDLFATAPTSVQVGRDRNYPNRKPSSAFAEVLTRYLSKQDDIPELEVVRKEGGDRVGKNLDAIRQLRTIIQNANGQLVLGLTPLLRELGESGPRDYELKARQRLKDFVEAEQIPYLDFLSSFSQVSTPKTLYHDHIHLSPEGNRHVSQRIIEVLQPLPNVMQ